MTAANRLSGADRSLIRARIAADLTQTAEPSIGADFNRLMRSAPGAIGCTSLDLRQSECDEIADMVCAAILDRCGVLA